MRLNNSFNVLDLRARFQTRNCPVGCVADHAELGPVEVLSADGLQREVSYVISRHVPPLGDDPAVLFHEETEHGSDWVHVSTLSQCLPGKDLEHRDWGLICSMLEQRYVRENALPFNRSAR